MDSRLNKKMQGPQANRRELRLRIEEIENGLLLPKVQFFTDKAMANEAVGNYKGYLELTKKSEGVNHGC